MDNTKGNMMDFSKLLSIVSENVNWQNVAAQMNVEAKVGLV